MVVNIRNFCHIYSDVRCELALTQKMEVCTTWYCPDHLPWE